MKKEEKSKRLIDDAANAIVANKELLRVISKSGLCKIIFLSGGNVTWHIHKVHRGTIHRSKKRCKHDTV